jgi:hypothetical protein
MTVKRFGPTLDAGVVVIEKEAEKTITPSLLGSTAYVGILDRGPVAELITTVGKKDLLAKTGGLIPDSLLPDCCQDFWDHSEGAGVLFLYRVTAGNEVAATLTLWDRSWPRNQVVQVDAHNGGSWGGKRDTVVADLDAVPTDIQTETTVKLPDLYVVAADKWKGGYVKFTETGFSYQIVSHTAGDGVDGAVVTVTADSQMLTDFAAGSDVEITLLNSSQDSWGQDKFLSVEVLDGQLNPSTEFGLKIYVNDELVKAYPDLSMDPNSTRYFVDMVNDDPTNWYVTVTDLWSGAIDADKRPANFYAETDAANITTKQIDFISELFIWAQTAGTGGPHTMAAFTAGASMVADRYKIDYTAAWDLTSDFKQTFHTFPAVVSATPFVADNPYSFGATLTETTPSSGDQITIWVLPFVADELIGGRIFFPEESFAPTQGWVITDNDEETVDITTGDLTDGGTIAGTIDVRLQYRQQLQDGYDGIADVDDADYTDAFDVATSPFNETENKGYGLIKFACPGITEILTSSLTSISDAQTVERGGVAYAEARNHQYRYEVQQTGTDEVVVRDYVQTVVGKSDHAKVCMHGYCKVSDPVLTDRLKTVPTMGMIHGREAWHARQVDGYHQVAAGIDVTFPRIRQLLTVSGSGNNAIPKQLNGEILNPAGLQRIEVKGGRFVLWGARIPSVDPAWKFSQHRELMSYYEHVLIESFDWVIFALNDPVEEAGLLAAVHSFFLPEWRPKRAIRGDQFKDAAKISIQTSDADRAAGNLNMDIELRLADTVERFIITIGKQGVFESTAPA